MLLIIDTLVIVLVFGLSLSYVPRWFWLYCYMFMAVFVAFFFTRKYGEKEFIDWFERELKKLPPWMQEGLK